MAMYARDPRGRVLNLRNKDQVVIFEAELIGQMSDGQWENSMPYDHWEPWAECDVTANDDKPVGRNFWVKRDSYGYTRKAFLGGPNDWPDIGGRMMGYVRVARAFGVDSSDARTARDGVKYYDDYRKRMDDYAIKVTDLIDRLGGVEAVKAAAENETLYNRKQLMADLRDIQKTIKVYV
jgi:hypothetical protein